VPAVLPAQEGASTIEIKEREAWLTVDRHFRGRITCGIWRWLSHRLRGFKRRIARWIMHRTTGRITFGRRYWIVERFRWSARARRHEDFLSLNLVSHARRLAAQRAGVHAPTHGVTSSDHSFLFKASAVLLAASFTAAFASPVAF
jgi:hypothetical protein